MELNAEQRSGIPVVSLPVRIEIDLANSEEFRQGLERSIGDSPMAVLDAANVEFFDSAGMGVLLAVHRTLEQRKGRLVLTGLTPPVREVFQMVGFDMIFQIYGDVAAAIDSFEESS